MAPISSALRGAGARSQSLGAGPLPSCGYRSLKLAVLLTLVARVLQMRLSSAALPEALTPPARLALSLSGPGVAAEADGCQGNWLREVTVQRPER